MLSGNTSQGPVLKFAAAAGATPSAGCLTPGISTNQIQERDSWWLPIPRLTASLPQRRLIALYNTADCCSCNTDSPLHYVDIAIPGNNETHSLGLLWWMLAWEALHLCGTTSCEHSWEAMPDVCFCRDPEESEKEERAAAEKALTKTALQGEWTAPAPELTAAEPEVAGGPEGQVPVQKFPAEGWPLSLLLETGLQATEWVRTTTEGP